MANEAKDPKPRRRRPPRRLLRMIVTTSAITSGVISILAWVLQGLFTPLINSVGQRLSLWARSPAALDFHVLEQRDDLITFVVENSGETPALVDAIAYCPAGQAYFSNMKLSDEFWAVARGPDSADHLSEKVELLHGPASADWSLFCFTGEMHRLLPFVYANGPRVVPPEESIEVNFSAVPGLVFLSSRARLNPGVGGFCGGVLMSEGRSFAKILECVHPSNPLANPATVDEGFKALREKRADEAAASPTPGH